MNKNKNIKISKDKEKLITEIKKLNKAVRKLKKSIPDMNYKNLFNMYFSDIVLLINKKQ